MYFCTAADSDFFEYTLQLIGSIHKVNYKETETIAIFDLGLTQYQRDFFNSIEKVIVCDVEMTHPDLLTNFALGRAGKRARGWYAWKPVIIKQMLNKYPYVLYLDSGCVVLRSLNGLFHQIRERGYFFVSLSPNIPKMPFEFTIEAHCTKPVKDKFFLHTPQFSWILNSPLIIAGIIGASRILESSFIDPMYELSKNLKYFEDDGSCAQGFGHGYSDMTLFSIYASLLQLVKNRHYELINICRNNEKFEIFIAGHGNIPKNASIVYQLRGRFHYCYFIKFKSGINFKNSSFFNISSHF